MACRPPASSTLTHISFKSHVSRSPSRCTPNSTNLGAMSVAASASSGLSLGRNISVCDSFVDELLSRVASAVKCCESPLTNACGSVARARMNGIGKSPKTSSIRFVITAVRDGRPRLSDAYTRLSHNARAPSHELRADRAQRKPTQPDVEASAALADGHAVAGRRVQGNLVALPDRQVTDRDRNVRAITHRDGTGAGKA